jgi:uncharacterized protein involved in exopolysaccharide biosynthesis
VSPSHRVSIDDEGALDLATIWSVLWGYKYLIMLVAGACGIVAGFFALASTPIYRAEAVVTAVRASDVGGAATLLSEFGGLASLAGVDVGAGGVGQERRAVLRSRRLVEEFVQRNNLLSVLLPNTSEPPTLWLAVERFRQRVLRIREDNVMGATTLAIEWTDRRSRRVGE